MPLLPPCRRLPAPSVVVVLTVLLPLLGCGARVGTDDPAEHVDVVENGLFVGHLETQMSRHHVPGLSIAVVDGGEIAWTRAHGLADAGSDRETTAETVFQASSITKAVTAAVALSLVDQGLLDLDADVNESLTSWTVPESEHTALDKVTLRRLLGHAACVNRPEGGFSHEGPPYPSTTQVLDGEWPATNDRARIECAPGSEVRYSNFGYVLVQLLIEDATGRPFAEVSRELVLEPLGMTSSSFVQPPPGPVLARAAVPHDEDGQPWPRSFNPHAVGQGGLWTTPSDLARFLIEFMGVRRGNPSRILSNASAAEMLRSQFPQLEGGRLLGLGFALLGDWGLLQAGADPGFRCLMAGFPGSGTGLVVMLNGEGGELLQLRLLLNFILATFVRPLAPVVALGVASALVLVTVPVIGVAGGLMDLVRRMRGQRSRSPRGVPFARPLAVLASCVLVGILYPFVIHAFTSHEGLAWSGGGPYSRTILVLVVVASALSLALGGIAVRAWSGSFWTPGGRLHYSLVATAALTATGLWWWATLGLA